MSKVLHLEAISRRFGDRQVLQDVTFDVVAGRMTGFVGANGAGKTTSMRIILGVLAPDSGEVTWQGSPLTREDRRRFGYMPEERGLYPKMSVRDQLTYLGRLHGLSAAAVRRNADELLEWLSLGQRADDPRSRPATRPSSGSVTPGWRCASPRTRSGSSVPARSTPPSWRGRPSSP
ncbi:ATP-binding cassette domain-containing protein [Dactylosporangium roseum]|uniref:ATP-binding cassette domain-containing protein n=1 Tax=Dactylosporangium roseum TaxID=47989 RepID=A0ABY5ZDU7_9ACTN|nr:ATP-binding cassette domain-containing protein [Dactylosporangium roseum]